jgi:hypothetical protein
VTTARRHGGSLTADAKVRRHEGTKTLNCLRVLRAFARAAGVSLLVLPAARQ